VKRTPFAYSEITRHEMMLTVPPIRTMACRRIFTAALALALTPWLAWAQSRPSQPEPPGNEPIPDVPTLLAQVRAHQRQMDALQENYTFREDDVTTVMDKRGKVKSTDSETYEVFFVNTHEVKRLIAKNGKPLDPGQQQKEQKRVMKEVDKAQQTPPEKTVSGKDVVISVSGILAVVKVSAPRRVLIDGRPTLTFNFTGDPHAKAHGLAEKAARSTSGSVWIDEKDRQVRRMSAQLDQNFHVGFGMFSLSKGSNMVFDQKLVNNELWLPTSADILMNAHALGVFGARIDVHIAESDYKKFHAEAIQQPGATVVPPGTH
jgi:hypothetical protein